MEPVDERLRDLTEIRHLMERSTKFLSLSGYAGVSAGLVAIAGAVLAWWKLRDPVEAAETFLVLDAAIVLLLALTCAIAFTTRMARRKGFPIWGPSTRQLLVSLALPLAAGGMFCMALWYHGIFSLIGPSMLVFYGLALLNSSKHTLPEVRLLAFGQTALGIVAAFVPDQWLYFWAAGFGLLHILYGLFMYRRYER